MTTSSMAIPPVCPCNTSGIKSMKKKIDFLMGQ
jgi:hypothetical protein